MVRNIRDTMTSSHLDSEADGRHSTGTNPGFASLPLGIKLTWASTFHTPSSSEALRIQLRCDSSFSFKYQIICSNMLQSGPADSITSLLVLKLKLKQEPTGHISSISKHNMNVIAQEISHSHFQVMQPMWHIRADNLHVNKSGPVVEFSSKAKRQEELSLTWGKISCRNAERQRNFRDQTSQTSTSFTFTY